MCHRTKNITFHKYNNLTQTYALVTLNLSTRHMCTLYISKKCMSIWHLTFESFQTVMVETTGSCLQPFCHNTLAFSRRTKLCLPACNVVDLEMFGVDIDPFSSIPVRQSSSCVTWLVAMTDDITSSSRSGSSAAMMKLQRISTYDAWRHRKPWWRHQNVCRSVTWQVNGHLLIVVTSIGRRTTNWLLQTPQTDWLSANQITSNCATVTLYWPITVILV